jgi:hypothetical protein
MEVIGMFKPLETNNKNQLHQSTEMTHTKRYILFCIQCSTVHITANIVRTSNSTCHLLNNETYNSTGLKNCSNYVKYSTESLFKKALPFSLLKNKMACVCWLPLTGKISVMGSSISQAN